MVDGASGACDHVAVCVGGSFILTLFHCCCTALLVRGIYLLVLRFVRFQCMIRARLLRPSP